MSETAVTDVSPEQINNNLQRPYHNILSVPFIALHLSRGLIPPQIAKIAGVSDVAVYRYIDRHREELEILAQGDDLLRYKLDYNNHKLVSSVTDEQIDKASPRDKYIMLGIGIEKSRLLQDKSTANVAIDGTLQDVHRSLFPTEKVEDNTDKQAIAEPDNAD